MTPEQIAARLSIETWPTQDRDHGRRAVQLAHRIYDGSVRDQGTPYIEHPVAVAEILRDIARMHQPQVLVLGLLHDALEINPTAAADITDQLGPAITAALRALTPDHRLAGRHRRPGDDDAYHRKIAALPDELLAVKLADRLHNLRDLSSSPNLERTRRFRVQLAGFYVPLAQVRAAGNSALAALAELLAADLGHEPAASS